MFVNGRILKLVEINETTIDELLEESHSDMLTKAEYIKSLGSTNGMLVIDLIDKTHTALKAIKEYYVLEAKKNA